MRSKLLTLLVVLLSAVALLGAETSPVERPPAAGPAQAAPPGEAGCLILSQGQLMAPPDTTVTGLDTTVVQGGGQAFGVRAPVRLSIADAGSSRSATAALGSRTGLVWAECAAPVTQTMLQLPDPATSDIVLLNTDGTDAVVNLTLYGADGEVIESGARGLSVARRSSRVVPMSVLAPAGEPVGVAVRTSQGRIIATARLSARAGGLDQALGLEPAQRQVVAGVPAKVTRVSLLLTNPGAEPVTASISILGARGAFTPSGQESVELEPMSTRALDLTTAVNGEPAAVRVDANRGEIAASLHVRLGADAALIPASEPSTDALVHAPGGTLHLVNPSDDDITVEVAGQSLSVAAGALVTLPVRAGANRVTGGPVVAVLVSNRGLAARRVLQVRETESGAQVSNDPGLR
ncbi:DUF5719 family protein [Aestuariimicrobium ganziense]|uniref:DUF5719 family protein n=1 Tax=Aestuariimicrobium ganziense TaxID=2773677 RepID=UPI001942E10C|nr:DUF5719 family protein [Aestuariimicrobium ganziense]